jgi:DNA invertase Pin-like site-specific DNA recombinase
MLVEKIKATPTLYGRKQEQTQKLKVAAYCRVSTDTEDQMNSYNSQMSYYKDLITKNKEYEFVGIYADPGITGTSTAKREEFQRMIADAKNKKIDLILTKSITRFERNTLDTLKYVRMLKEVGVADKHTFPFL